MLSEDEAREQWKKLKEKYPELADFEEIRKALITFSDDTFKDLVSLVLEIKQRLISLRDAVEAWLNPGTWTQGVERSFLKEAGKWKDLQNFLIEVQKNAIKSAKLAFSLAFGEGSIEELNSLVSKLAELNKSYISFVEVVEKRWSEAKNMEQEVHYQW